MWPFKKKEKQELSNQALQMLDVVGRLATTFLGQPHVVTTPFIAEPVPAIAWHPRTPEEIETEKQEMTEIDAFLTKIDPEIKVQTEALIKEEVRDALLLGGNRQRILELLRAGRMPKIIRKKEGRRDPLFLQWGDGLNEPVEEMRVLG